MSSIAYISLPALRHNMGVLQDIVGPNVKLWPAVKANAYGHGAVGISRCLVQLGYDVLCVAHVGEAQELMAEKVGAKHILVLAGVVGGDFDEVVAAGGVIEPVVSSLETLKAVSQAAVKKNVVVGIHLQCDTGMVRQGCNPVNFAAFVEQAKATPGVTVKSTMSHFACAESSPEITQRQIGIFEKQPRAGLRHICNSAGLFLAPQAHFDVCRPGIAIYGLLGDVGHPAAQKLLPVMRLESRVTLVRLEVPKVSPNLGVLHLHREKGTGISYGHRFVTQKDNTTLAVISCGYGDGYSRHLTQKGAHAIVRGKKCPIVGAITMDQMILDVSEVAEPVEIGDRVVLFGTQVTANELATLMSGISYEVTTCLTSRVRREIEEK